MVLVFAKSVQFVPSAEYCHLFIGPECPERVNKPLVLPVHTGVPPVTFPLIDNGFTVTVVAVAYAIEQTPLCTIALYCVVSDRIPEVYVVFVFVMSVQELPLVEDCHFIMDPVCPAIVNNPLVLPSHIVFPPETTPPMVGGETVTIVSSEFVA